MTKIEDIAYSGPEALREEWLSFVRDYVKDGSNAHRISAINTIHDILFRPDTVEAVLKQIKNSRFLRQDVHDVALALSEQNDYPNITPLFKTAIESLTQQ